jgi:hypothetical protein
MTRLVQLAADYGPGDLAYAELTQRLALAVPRSSRAPDGAEGDLHCEPTLSAGSGWPSRRGGRRCFLELFVSGGQRVGPVRRPGARTALQVST